MGTVKETAEALRRLAAPKIGGRSKTAILRSLIDEVEAALPIVGREQVIKTLKEQGIDFTANSFGSALSRIRRERAKGSKKNPPAVVVGQEEPGPKKRPRRVKELSDNPFLKQLEKEDDS